METAQMRFGDNSGLITAADTKHCEELVDNVMKKLRIDEQAEQTIGTISGGQRKRFCIARELVTKPELLLCDEPTSGLDSSLAKILIEHLREIVDTDGTTVVCSVQQPSESIFSTFDMIMFLHKGECVYFGPPQGVLAHLHYFGKGLKMEIDDGVPNFLMDVLSNDVLSDLGGLENAKFAVKRQVQKTIQLMASSPVWKASQEQRHAERRAPGNARGGPAAWLRQFFILSRRLNKITAKQIFAVNNIIVWVMIQVICAPIFFQPSANAQGIFTRQSLCLFMVGIPYFSLSFIVFPRSYQYANILTKDLQSGNHSLSCYWAARLIGTLWLDLILPLVANALFNAICWPYTKVITFVYVWLSFFGICTVIIWFNYAVPQFFSMSHGQMFLITWIMFSFFWTEFFAPGDTVVDGLKWLKWVSNFDYSYNIVVDTIFSDDVVFPCSQQAQFEALSSSEQVANILCPSDANCKGFSDVNPLKCDDIACLTRFDLNGCAATGTQIRAQQEYIFTRATFAENWIVYMVGYGLGFFLIGWFG